MSDVKTTLSPSEADVYSGACLTYMGVPFHRVDKARTTPADLRRLDELFDRFVRAKGELRRKASEAVAGSIATSPATSVGLVLSAQEMDLLIEVLETVLEEHVASDYDLELHVAPREDVESALAKLREVRQEQPR